MIESIATKSSPALSRGSRFAIKAFADMVRYLDVGADDETLEACAKVEAPAVVAARRAYTELLRCCPVKKPTSKPVAKTAPKLVAVAKAPPNKKGDWTAADMEQMNKNANAQFEAFMKKQADKATA